MQPLLLEILDDLGHLMLERLHKFVPFTLYTLSSC